MKFILYLDLHMEIDKRGKRTDNIKKLQQESICKTPKDEIQNVFHGTTIPRSI